jgi:integrase
MPYAKARQIWRTGAKTIVKGSCEFMRHSHALSPKNKDRKRSPDCWLRLVVFSSFRRYTIPWKRQTGSKSSTKREALTFEKYIKDQEQDKPYLGEKTDKRRVIELVELWYNSHGVTLADGEHRQGAMAFACEAMAYLTHDEIRSLLAECDKSRAKDLTTIVKICLATGARWSEAEGLKGS